MLVFGKYHVLCVGPVLIGFLVFLEQVHSQECKYTIMGTEYKGQMSKTKSGKTCQYWVAQTPHRHYHNDPAKFPDHSLRNAANYCRNPDRKSRGPWCYTNDTDVTFEYCDIPMCDCKDTQQGQEYNGKQTTTKNGIVCQRWDSQSPHTHISYNVSSFPEHNLQDAENYCRNPDNNPQGPWCYINSNGLKKHCNIYQCECKMDSLGKKYIGKNNETLNKNPCQRWDQQHPHKHGNNASDISLANNYCRNPDNEPGGPWCYTLKPDVRWAYCHVPYCRTAMKPKLAPSPVVKDLDSCKRNRMGMEYNGNISVTSTGRTCQAWNSQSPHNHTETDVTRFPDADLPEASNYCRNPDAQKNGPWCFTTDPAVQWEFCSVPECACKLTRKGENYMGQLSETKAGYGCKRWDSSRTYQDSDFPDGSVTAAKNYCRNPTSTEKPDGPWCFTTNPAVPFDYCAIPDCDCKKSTLGNKYIGQTDYTIYGRRCQRWDSQTPHRPSKAAQEGFPDSSIEEAANYCRNPDNEPGGPWCYTLDKAVRWEYCAIDLCPIKDKMLAKTTAQKSAKATGGLSGGGVAGVTLACILGVAALILIILGFLFLRRRRRCHVILIHNSSCTNPSYIKLNDSTIGEMDDSTI